MQKFSASTLQKTKRTVDEVSTDTFLCLVSDSSIYEEKKGNTTQISLVLVYTMWLISISSKLHISLHYPAFWGDPPSLCFFLGRGRFWFEGWRWHCSFFGVIIGLINFCGEESFGCILLPLIIWSRSMMCLPPKTLWIYSTSLSSQAFVGFHELRHFLVSLHLFQYAADSWSFSWGLTFSSSEIYKANFQDLQAPSFTSCHGIPSAPLSSKALPGSSWMRNLTPRTCFNIASLIPLWAPFALSANLTPSKLTITSSGLASAPHAGSVSDFSLISTFHPWRRLFPRRNLWSASLSSLRFLCLRHGISGSREMLKYLIALFLVRPLGCLTSRGVSSFLQNEGLACRLSQALVGLAWF